MSGRIQLVHHWPANRWRLEESDKKTRKEKKNSIGYNGPKTLQDQMQKRKNGIIERANHRSSAAVRSAKTTLEAGVSAVRCKHIHINQKSDHISAAALPN